MKTVIAAFGTRPEAIKMCPLIKEIKKRSRYDLKVVLTGQHAKILDDVLRDFGLSADYNLGIMKIGHTLLDITVKTLMGVESVIKKHKPNFVLIHGDTSSSFASALAAFYNKVPIAHIESGLRTYRTFEPYPEEFNRKSIDAMSTLHFAPTENAKNALLKEGVKESGIYVVGNSVIDALKQMIEENFSHNILTRTKGYKLIVLTVHRRENWGNGMLNIFRAVKRLCKEQKNIRILFPTHPNPDIMRLANEFFKEECAVIITPPLSVKEFHNILASSYAVITDSGGIQEEASYLGKPLFIAREVTERRELENLPCAYITGCDEESLYLSVSKILTDEREYKKMAVSTSVFGVGDSSSKIADILDNYI